MSCACPSPASLLYFPGGTAARFRQAVTIVGSDPVVPLDLTGATIVVILKKSLTQADDATGNITLTVANGGIEIAGSPTLGLYDIVFLAETTASMEDYITWYVVPRITLADASVQIPRAATLRLRLDALPPDTTCGEFAGATLIRGDLYTAGTNPTELDPPPLPPYATEAYVTATIASALAAAGQPLTAHTGAPAALENVVAPVPSVRIVQTGTVAGGNVATEQWTLMTNTDKVTDSVTYVVSLVVAGAVWVRTG